MATAHIIGAHTSHIRQAPGISLLKVASELCVSPRLSSQVETGKGRPSVSILYSLAGFLGVSADQLLGLAGAERSPAPSAVPTFPASTPEVQRASENPAIEMEDGVRWERLASSPDRSEEHTSELQSLMRISSAVFCLKKKKPIERNTSTT